MKSETKYIIVFTVLVALFFAFIVVAFRLAYREQPAPKKVNEYRIDGSEALPEEVPESLQIPKLHE